MLRVKSPYREMTPRPETSAKLSGYNNLITTIDFRLARDSGAMPCLCFCASVEIFDQHDVAFDSVKAGIDDLLSVRRDIKAASGSSGRPDVHHT